MTCRLRTTKRFRSDQSPSGTRQWRSLRPAHAASASSSFHRKRCCRVWPCVRAIICGSNRSKPARRHPSHHRACPTNSNRLEDLRTGRLTVRAPKTEHHEVGGLRIAPIFTTFQSYVQALHDLAQPAADCSMSTPVPTRWTSEWPDQFSPDRAATGSRIIGVFFDVMLSWYSARMVSHPVPAAPNHEWLGHP